MYCKHKRIVIQYKPQFSVQKLFEVNGGVLCRILGKTQIAW